MSAPRRSARLSAKTETPKYEEISVVLSKPNKRVQDESDELEEDPKPAVKKSKPVKAAKASEPAKNVKTDELQVGDSIPDDLELENQDAEPINLLQLAKDSKILVVFLYPRASTPGCTRQAKGFRDQYEILTKELGATLVGLSSDSPKSQTTFKTKQGLQYDLLCDPTKKFIGILGAKKQPSGIIRSHFIFVDGILKVKKLKVSPEDSYNGAVAQVKELQ